MFRSKRHRRIILWLAATKTLANYENSLPASRAWADLFAYKSRVTAEELTRDFPRVNTETVRRGRVRLDFAMMLMWRCLFEVLLSSLDVPYFYLFSDASPQWQGMELFASTLDMLHGGTITRRLLPVVCLSRDNRDAIGKTIGLMWQIVLMTGACYFRFRAWC